MKHKLPKAIGFLLNADLFDTVFDGAREASLSLQEAVARRFGFKAE